MPRSRSYYRKRTCARCGAPIQQRIEEIVEGKEPLCSNHALEESIQRMNEVIRSLHAAIARQTIDLLRERGVDIPDDTAEQVVEQLRSAPRDAKRAGATMEHPDATATLTQSKP